MVDPITLAVGGFALYKGLKHKKAKEREREENERREMQRIANEQAERARKAASDRAQKIRDAKAAAARVREEQAEAEKTLKEGYPPRFAPPGREEVEAMKYARQYDPYNIHLAIAGISGSGKSSLINAIRGLANNDQSAIMAATGVTETTKVIGRYPMSDVRPDSRIVLYDVPGAGTLEIPGRDYFNSQGLYMFDAIIVLFDNRFTQTDIAILQNCEVVDIPCFVVRSKSDMHIENILQSMPGFPSDSDDYDHDNDDTFRAQYLPAACDNYVQQTRATVTDNLAQAGLGPKDVYLVSRSALRRVTNAQEIGRSQILLDEQALLRNLSNFVPLRLFK
jgi:signal recognition particle receptor subunit beta